MVACWGHAVRPAVEVLLVVVTFAAPSTAHTASVVTCCASRWSCPVLWPVLLLQQCLPQGVGGILAGNTCWRLYSGFLSVQCHLTLCLPRAVHLCACAPLLTGQRGESCCQHPQCWQCQGGSGGSSPGTCPEQDHPTTWLGQSRIWAHFSAYGFERPQVRFCAGGGRG